MSVLSFRKSVDQLDRGAEREAGMQRCLAGCIQSAGDYAIELKNEDTEKLRANLKTLAARVASTSDQAGADKLQADDSNDDAILRYNTCVRLLAAHRLTEPAHEPDDYPLE